MRANKPKKEVTLERERRFAAAWLTNGHNAVEAYQLAGWRAKSNASAAAAASFVLHRPRVQELIRGHRERLEKKCEVNREWIVNHAVEVIERAMQAVPVLDRDGNQVDGQWRFNGKVALQGLELLAKMFGYVTRQVRVDKQVTSFGIKVDVPSLGKYLPVETLREVVAAVRKVKEERQALPPPNGSELRQDDNGGT